MCLIDGMTLYRGQVARTNSRYEMRAIIVASIRTVFN